MSTSTSAFTRAGYFHAARIATKPPCDMPTMVAAGMLSWSSSETQSLARS